MFGRSTTGYTETKGASGIVFAMLAHAAATDPAAPMFVYSAPLLLPNCGWWYSIVELNRRVRAEYY